MSNTNEELEATTPVEVEVTSELLPEPEGQPETTEQCCEDCVCPDGTTCTPGCCEKCPREDGSYGTIQDEEPTQTEETEQVTPEVETPKQDNTFNL